MARLIRSSNSIRALKARLHVLKRPMFWVSTTVLGLALVLMVDAWKGENWLEGAGDRPQLLDPSDVGTGADIPGFDTTPPSSESLFGSDTNSLLDFTDLGTLAPETEDSAGEPASGDTASSTDPTGFSPRPAASGLGMIDSSSPNRESNVSTPFERQFLEGNPTNSSSSALSTPSPGLESGWADPPNFESPLRQSLERSPTLTNGSPGTNRDRTTSPQLQPELYPSLQPSASPAQRTPAGFVEPPSVQSSPTPGTTGYTRPPSLSELQQRYSPVPTAPSPSSVAPSPYSQPLSGYGNTATPGGGLSSPALVEQRPSTSVTPLFPQSSQPPQPYTGGGRGGQINTFSNP